MRRAEKSTHKAKARHNVKKIANEKPVEARHPSEDEIRRRAYEIYVGRGGTPGHELDDWILAERELQGQPA